jgi:hypothetical protein
MEQEHVDEVMRGVQGASEKAQADRFHPVPVWMGMAGTLKLRWRSWTWQGKKG